MKKFFIIAAVAAASIFGLVKANDVNVNNSMSDLQMENLEALGQKTAEVVVDFICIGGGHCATMPDGVELTGVKHQ